MQLDNKPQQQYPLGQNLAARHRYTGDLVSVRIFRNQYRRLVFTITGKHQPLHMGLHSFEKQYELIQEDTE